MSDIAYVNGRFMDLSHANIPIDERGQQFGDGVYEVIRVYRGKPFLLDWHIERLFNGLRAIRIESPFTFAACWNLIQEAVARSDCLESTVYLQITRGIAPRKHLFPETSPSVTIIVRAYHKPVHEGLQKLLLWPDERWANAYIKTLNLLPNVLAKQSAHDVGAYEALLVRDGKMLEASSANVWFVLAGKLVTAPANRFILSGITRRFVLEIAHQLSIPVDRRPVGLAEIGMVDEVFLTGTTTEVHGIDEVIASPYCKLDFSGLSDVIPEQPIFSPMDCSPVWQRRDDTITNKIQTEFALRVAAAHEI